MSLGTVVLHKEEELDPVELTRKLNIMNEVRINFRRERAAATGRIVQCTFLDAAIEELERLLALHLPQKPPEEML